VRPLNTSRRPALPKSGLFCLRTAAVTAIHPNGAPGPPPILRESTLLQTRLRVLQLSFTRSSLSILSFCGVAVGFYHPPCAAASARHPPSIPADLNSSASPQFSPYQKQKICTQNAVPKFLFNSLESNVTSAYRDRIFSRRVHILSTICCKSLWFPPFKHILIDYLDVIVRPSSGVLLLSGKDYFSRIPLLFFSPL